MNEINKNNFHQLLQYFLHQIIVMHITIKEQ